MSLMTAYALKEWAVTCDALAAGAQVVVLRKGGIGEKRFALPHPEFFLFPTYAHQRPELVSSAAARTFADALHRRDDPGHLPMPLVAQLVDALAVRDPAALDAVDDLHILTHDYAAERLKWRRTQPLWAAVLRVWRVDPVPVLEITEEHGGCVSWITLPEGFGEGTVRTPVMDDATFEVARTRVTDALRPFAEVA
mgnify:CR=1 FL=1